MRIYTPSTYVHDIHSFAAIIWPAVVMILSYIKINKKPCAKTKHALARCAKAIFINNFYLTVPTALGLLWIRVKLRTMSSINHTNN